MMFCKAQMMIQNKAQRPLIYTLIRTTPYMSLEIGFIYFHYLFFWRGSELRVFKHFQVSAGQEGRMFRAEEEAAMKRSTLTHKPHKKRRTRKKLFSFFLSKLSFTCTFFKQVINNYNEPLQQHDMIYPILSKMIHSF